tara:strand:+ start:976 stop:1290 length:315 start_codon:yes stop_codon:yes gene_type:complete
MNEPRWYVVNAAGNMHACVDEEGARQKVILFDAHNSEFGPHRAVQLVDAAELEQAHKRIVELEKAKHQLTGLINLAEGQANRRIAELEAEIEQAMIECTNAINN